MKQKTKEFFILFLIQVCSYTLLCINYRAVAQAEYVSSAISDFIIASFNFFVIKRIAKSDDAIHQWLGYASGGFVGSILGIYISKVILGS